VSKRITFIKWLYNLMLAAGIVAVLPAAILIIVAQEKIVSGFTTGVVKK
jgi:multiple sugar transport system permease protein